MLTIERLASELGISTRQIQRYQAHGLPFQPVGVRGKRYDLEACKAWLRENYLCLSSQPKAEVGKSLSASTINDYTAACRKVQLRVTPAPLRQN